MKFIKSWIDYYFNTNPKYKTLLKQYGYGITKLSDNHIISIDENEAVFIYLKLDTNMYGHKEYIPVKHNIDGPSIVSKDKKLEDKWYIRGFDITTQLKYWTTLNDIDLDNLTDVDKLYIRTQFLTDFKLSEQDFESKNPTYLIGQTHSKSNISPINFIQPNQFLTSAAQHAYNNKTQ